MPHELVKITQDEYGCPVLEKDQVWHLGWEAGGSPACFCDAQVYGRGEGDALFEIKFVLRGGITCKKCLEEIKAVKKVRL